MEDINEAIAAQILASPAVTCPEFPPGFWERLERLRQAEGAWLQTVPGQWWQAKRTEREEAINVLLKQLEELGAGFDPDEIGIIGGLPDVLKLARCSDCGAETIEDCMGCALWPVIDGE